MKLEEWLSADRERTQERLAEAMGVDQATISRIMRGGDCSAATMRLLHLHTGGEVTPNDVVLRAAA